MSSQRWRIIITLGLIVMACLAFWNTFEVWTMSDEQRQEMQEEQPDELLALQQKAIRLGLDLQGGIHVVLRVKFEEMDTAAYEGAVDRAIQVIRNRIDGLGVTEPNIQKQGNSWIVVDLPGYTDADRAEDIIGQTAQLEFKLLENYENASLLMDKIDSIVYAHEMASVDSEGSTADEAAEATMDETPADDTDAEASDDLLAELTGDTAAKDTSDNFDEFAFQDDLPVEDDTRPFTTRAEHFLFSRETNQAWPAYHVEKSDKIKMDRWLALPEVQEVIPRGVQFAWSTRSQILENREVFELYLLKRNVEFVGKYLHSIQVGQGNMGGWTVTFSLSGEGASRFAGLTGRHINKPLAIVIDDRVESAPNIRSRIRNNGEITMGSSATLEDAKNLSIVLKAGALPAPVEIIEKNLVGATLGADSINSGFTALMIGLVLVFLFIGLYYRLSGVIADIGLVFNIFFLLAVMAGLGATLTMPGIAGIILTIGISVDANILIFERIREELRTGKTVRASIDAGYQRAFVAIFDSHVTTLITAGALFIFGSGPIKGFAVTLFWGVVISLYTAYVITKAIFDVRKAYKTLSI